MIHPGCTSGISLSERTFSTASLFKICKVKKITNTNKIDLCFCGNITVTGYYIVPASNTKLAFILGAYIHNVPGSLVEPLELDPWGVRHSRRAGNLIVRSNLSISHRRETPHWESSCAETRGGRNTTTGNDLTLHTDKLNPYKGCRQIKITGTEGNPHSAYL
jgi:hypothetical protein